MAFHDFGDGFVFCFGLYRYFLSSYVLPWGQYENITEIEDVIIDLH